VHDLAGARRLSSTVLTFDRHPAEVVRPGSAPKLLTTLEQKLELLDATAAVDECLVLAFDEARSKEPAEDFVSEVLAGVLGARLVVVGADFHFGYKRHGDVALLQRMGAELGFEVLGLGLVASPESADAPDGGIPYSSTRARERRQSASNRYRDTELTGAAARRPPGGPRPGGLSAMPIAAHRWLMTAPGAPLARMPFDATPGPGEVAVAVAGCGVCHTDLGYYYDGVRTNAPLPLMLGHEIAGRVVAAGEGAEGWIGSAVIVPAVLPCGKCDLCERGLALCQESKHPYTKP
jgi:hypothetical protein